MPRARGTDILLAHQFHVLDVSFSIPPVFLPVWGFQACTAPEMSITYREIKEGNYEYPRKVVERAEVGEVTLEVGSSLLRSDFWDWVSGAVVGKKPKKNLLIVHFTGMAGTGTISGEGMLNGIVEFNFRIPGKAWLLMNCSPARYKAGTDFDAITSAPSIQTLDVAFEEFIEFNLGVG